MNKMIIKKPMQFFAEDDGGVAGILGPVGEPAPVDPPTNGDPPVDPPPTDPPAPTLVDAKSLAAEFGSVLGQHFPKQPAGDPVQQPLTAEQAKKLLNVWEPGDDYFQRFGNLDTQKQAFLEMRDNLIKQADTIAQFRMQEMQKAWEAKFTPVQSLIEQHTARQNEEKFHEAFPQLKNEALKPLIYTVAGQLRDGGSLTGKSQTEIFKAIASGVEAVIKATNPEFKLTAGTPAAKPTGARGGGIPVTTHGAAGGGGSGGSSGGTSGRPKAVQLLPQIGASA